MFHRIFTGKAQSDAQANKARDGRIDMLTQDVQLLVARCGRLERELALVAASLDAHAAALHKLRGQFFGPRAHDDPRPRLEARQVQHANGTLKDELRRRAGITAGKPTIHAARTDNQDNQDEA
ncbi:MAG TPA: hypothetical protein VF077_04965 [Nitrospiraceae bacterium]